jgi:hypothetical protein
MAYRGGGFNDAFNKSEILLNQFLKSLVPLLRWSHACWMYLTAFQLIVHRRRNLWGVLLFTLSSNRQLQQLVSVLIRYYGYDFDVRAAKKNRASTVSDKIEYFICDAIFFIEIIKLTLLFARRTKCSKNENGTSRI